MPFEAKIVRPGRTTNLSPDGQYIRFWNISCFPAGLKNSTVLNSAAKGYNIKRAVVEALVLWHIVNGMPMRDFPQKGVHIRKAKESLHAHNLTTHPPRNP